MSEVEEKINVQKEILKFRNDAETSKLIDYYSEPSYMEMLGVSRKEDAHSRFLAWLFDNSSNHQLGNFAVRKLLEFLISDNKNRARISSLPKDFLHALIINDIRITDMKIEREKYITNVGKNNIRLDLYIELRIPFNGKNNIVKLIIENKVKSSENDQQTQKYYNYFDKEKKEKEIEKKDIKEKKIHNIYLYLTPISNDDLQALTEPECDCKEFIQINYQMIADVILTPILTKNTSPKVKEIIQDYLNALSRPAINLDDVSTNTGELIMAYQDEEKELLTKFWDKNQALILKAAQAKYDDPETDVSDKETLKPLINASKKTRPNFKFHMLDIKPSTTLTFKNKPDITCETVDENNKVKYNGEEMTISAAAGKVIEEHSDSTHTSVAGTLHWFWKHDDGTNQSLDEWRNQFEEDKKSSTP